MVTLEEQALIADRMAEAGISNMGAYMRKMALNGYVLHVDLSDIRELVALQRRCANNLNQVAVHANTYGVLVGIAFLIHKCPPICRPGQGHFSLGRIAHGQPRPVLRRFHHLRSLF